MKKLNSAEYTAILAEGLTISELPLKNRSDRWWDMFWYYRGLTESKRLKGRNDEAEHR